MIVQLIFNQEKNSCGQIYNLEPPEFKVLQGYIKENLTNGFIWNSIYFVSAPILFDNKKDGLPCLVVDALGLNKVTIQNWHAFSLISTLLECLSGAKYFTKLNLRGTYNMIRIRSGYELKT